jgi:fatty acid desaturase
MQRRRQIQEHRIDRPARPIRLEAPRRRSRRWAGRLVDMILGALGMLVLVRLGVWLLDAPWELTLWARPW